MENWSWKDAPIQEGKIAIVTGANTGIGLSTAMVLAQSGAKVVLACRDIKKAEEARRAILLELPGVLLDVMPLDLSSLEFVRKFAHDFNAKYKKLDLLINNAGVMYPPYQKTEDGFELQFGVNHLGHFLLTSLLLPKLEMAENARVVSLGSMAHKRGDIYFDDLNFEKGYDRKKAYAQSKLACVMFAYELQRRLEKEDSSVKSLAAHPGLSDTQLMRHLPTWMKFITPIVKPIFVQSAYEGAQPILRAALDEDLIKGGEYLGPSGKGERKGKPVIVDSTDISKDKEKAKKLWEVSEKLVDRKFFSESKSSKKPASSSSKSASSGSKPASSGSKSASSGSKSDSSGSKSSSTGSKSDSSGSKSASSGSKPAPSGSKIEK